MHPCLHGRNSIRFPACSSHTVYTSAVGVKVTDKDITAQRCQVSETAPAQGPPWRSFAFITNPLCPLRTGPPCCSDGCSVDVKAGPADPSRKSEHVESPQRTLRVGRDFLFGLISLNHNTRGGSCAVAHIRCSSNRHADTVCNGLVKVSLLRQLLEDVKVFRWKTHLLENTLTPTLYERLRISAVPDIRPS
ncbi:hypothetical protein SKAU_G00240180 [Synaphobranchus kaupii]|uniref:Uncharacterized protein n=1 Tax=Synaphobranchus kaupii TaxID=118154 RepID=A0A9Q1ITT4_SYNKA|nr:hypothetical protein SKAU_G00240180 [Synaphobranchus kaupii]